MTDDNLEGLHREAKGTTLSAIASASAKVESLLVDNRCSEIQQLSEGIEDMAQAIESLTEAERALAGARRE